MFYNISEGMLEFERCVHLERIESDISSSMARDTESIEMLRDTDVD